MQMGNGRAGCHSSNTRWANPFLKVMKTYAISKSTWSVYGGVQMTHHTVPMRQDPAKGRGGQEDRKEEENEEPEDAGVCKMTGVHSHVCHERTETICFMCRMGYTGDPSVGVLGRQGSG